MKWISQSSCCFTRHLLPNRRASINTRSRVDPVQRDGHYTPATATSPSNTTVTEVKDSVSTTAISGCANGDRATMSSGTTVPTQTNYVPTFSAACLPQFHWRSPSNKLPIRYFNGSDLKRTEVVKAAVNEPIDQRDGINWSGKLRVRCGCQKFLEFTGG
jgi:hypothetical protein